MNLGSCSHDGLNKNGEFMVFLSYYFETDGLDSVEYYAGGPCSVNQWKTSICKIPVKGPIFCDVCPPINVLENLL
jgi:hypothetical protein